MTLKRKDDCMKKNKIDVTDSLVVFDSFEELEETKRIFEYTFLIDMHSRDSNDWYSNDRVIRYFQIPQNLMGGGTFWQRLEIGNDTNFQKQGDWFKHHCYISALYTIKYLLWKEGAHEIYHGSTIYLNDDYNEWYGKLDCDKKDYFMYENNVSKFFRYDCKGNATKERNMAFAYSLLGKKSGIPLPKDNSLGIPKYNWKLYDHIIENRSFFFRIKDVREMRLDRFTELMKSYADIATIKLIEEDNEFDIEAILLKYQLERYFNASLFEYIHQKHAEYHEDEDRNINLSGERYLTVMSKFSMLPNVFSRKKFVEWAYYSISKENQDKIYWNYFSQPNETTTNLIESIESNKQIVENNKHPQGASMAFGTWINTIERAIEYLSSVIFPFQEKCFFVWKYTKIADENSLTEPIEILKLMEKELEAFLKENKKQIFEKDYAKLDISFKDWDYYSENCPDKETACFYLGILNAMMKRNDLQNLYKITYSRDYFMPDASNLKTNLFINIDFYQRQFWYFKNMSSQRNVEFKREKSQ